MSHKDIIIILDRSGSMQERKADHEGGLRSFVGDVARMPEDVRITFVQFDTSDPCEVVFEQRPSREIQPEEIELVPRGGTPLLDAVGQTLTRFAEKCSNETIVMIITDGQENQSRKWKKEGVKKLIQEQEAKGWKILYLGANVDEFAEAGALGISPQVTLAYAGGGAGGGTQNMYRVVAANAGATYAAQGGGQDWAQATSNLFFTKEQRTDSKVEQTTSTQPTEKKETE